MQFLACWRYPVWGLKRNLGRKIGTVCWQPINAGSRANVQGLRRRIWPFAKHFAYPRKCSRARRPRLCYCTRSSLLNLVHSYIHMEFIVAPEAQSILQWVTSCFHYLNSVRDQNHCCLEFLPPHSGPRWIYRDQVSQSEYESRSIDAKTSLIMLGKKALTW
jgi:hypothetical protein